MNAIRVADPGQERPCSICIRLTHLIICQSEEGTESYCCPTCQPKYWRRAAVKDRRIERDRRRRERRAQTC